MRCMFTATWGNDPTWNGTLSRSIWQQKSIEILGYVFVGFEDPDAQLFNYIHYLFAKPCVFIIQDEQRQLLTVLQSSTVYCLESEARRSRSE